MSESKSEALKQSTRATTNATASTAANPGSDGQKFARKLDPTEQKRLEEQFKSLKEQSSQFITDEKDQTRTLEAIGTTAKGQVLDLKKIPTLYFKNCHGSTYTIDHRTTKVLIENCHDCKFIFNATVLTACFEMWKCKSCHIESQYIIKTFQLDLSSHITLTLPHVDDFGQVVWNAVEDLHFRFTKSPEHDLSTGFNHMKSTLTAEEIGDHPLNMITDQFIVRVLEKKLKSELCIRLKNGFLSTEREAAAWEKKNASIQEAFVQTFLKDSGLTLNRKMEKKHPPNDPCHCGSGMKYKKCCMNKKVLTGVEGDLEVNLYKKEKKNKEGAGAAAAATSPATSPVSAPVDAPEQKE